MAKPKVLQVGPYPQWDEDALNAAFDVHRYFDAADKPAFLADVDPGIRGIATRGELGANRAMIEACPNLEVISVCEPQAFMSTNVDLEPAQIIGYFV